ncbi:hypothetical protein DMI60_17950 [Escherichia coli]|nr:hypothetical protein [Escherichia coli]
MRTETGGAGRWRFAAQPSTDGRQNSKADVVLGLDNNLLDAASKTGLFAKSGVAAEAVNVLAAGIMTLSYRLITAISPSSMTRTN